MRQHFSKPKRMVIKIGSHLLLKDNTANITFIRHIAKQVSILSKSGIQIIIVSSGAIGCGQATLGEKQKPSTLPEKQAAAAIGQSRLMHLYDKSFEKHSLITAQILLTSDDLRNRKRYLNITNTLNTLLKKGIIPIINENDTLSTQEIQFGDNDTLAALVTNLVHADLLVLLSTIDGLMDYKNNQQHLLVQKITPAITRLVQDSTTPFGTGGMTTKLEAAKIVTQAGHPIIIANGNVRNGLIRISQGDEIGTLFLPQRQLTARKSWMAYAGLAKGVITIDKGASDAIIKQHKSLLAAGITKTSGQFNKGDIVEIRYNKKIIARGQTNYTNTDLNLIKGKQSSAFKSILGDKLYNEVIHRDNMVFTKA